MRIGHIIYKTPNLKQTVEEWREKGFEVEYGTKGKSHNALIYFTEGPFIELLGPVHIPSPVQFLMKLFGKYALHRFKKLIDAPYGWVDMAIEKDPGDLTEEINYLKSRGMKGTYLRHSYRKDTKNRKLKFKNFFPENNEMPFLMSYYTMDPKPKDFTQPNGLRRIKSITYRVHPSCKEELEHLVDDPTLRLVCDGQDSKILEVEYE
ncbi:MAG: VOC family protein [Tissierellia bacterium]|nr:VOC family protein [Tissierellia bacterium]